MYPEIRIASDLIIPTYFLVLSLVFSFVVILVYRRAQKLKVDVDRALHLCLLIMVFGFLGGRAMHVFYEQPQIYFENPSWVLQVWRGGYVFYGGALAATAACAIYLWRMKDSFLKWADFFVPAIAIGYSLGRLSCFVAGCCYGKACILPWAVRFAGSQATRHPTQAYTTLWEFAGFSFLILLERKDFFKTRIGLLFFIYLAWHSLGRIWIESFRDDFRGHLIAGLSISMWMSFILFGLSLCAIAQKLRSTT
jgi:phosphatidylglycerol:prolipoprotein diacylglycerol transferase